MRPRFKRTAMFLSLAMPLALPGPTVSAQSGNQATQKIEARQANQCARASRQFSLTNFNRAKAQIEATDMDASLKARRIEQVNQFWMVSRFNSNVTRCRSWFERGRTSPFSPG